MTEKINKMQQVLAVAAQEVAKFERGNSAAGTRLRKALQEIKTLAQEVRVEIQTQKNGQ